MSFYGFLCNRFSLYIKVTLKALFRHANFYEKNIKILLLFSSVLWSMTFVYSLSDLLKAGLKPRGGGLPYKTDGDARRLA